MEELIHKLGIEPKILLAQVINFFILLIVLWRLLYKPLQTLMAQRSQRIAQGLENARKMEEERSQWQEERAQMVEEARREVQRLAHAAHERSQTIEHQAREYAQERAAVMLSEAKAMIKREHDNAMQELESHIVKMVTTVAGQFLKKTMTAKEDAAMIKKLFSKHVQSKEE